MKFQGASESMMATCLEFNMTTTFVTCRRRLPIQYACWLTVCGLTVKGNGPTRGHALWEAWIAAYLAIKRIRRG